MATTPTQDAVPSESPRDLKFNAGKIDEFVTSSGWTYTDRFGNKHYTIEGINYLAQQVMNSFGYVTLTGVSFTTGATVTKPNEVLFNEANNEYYKWTGSFSSGPKVVPANSTPESTGGIGAGKWLSVGDSTLRGELAAEGGAEMVGYGQTTVKGALDELNQANSGLYDKDGFNLVGRFLNLSELRSKVPAAAGQIVYVASAASATATEKHYGGGYFQSFDNSTSPIADDGGIVIVPTTGALAWRRIVEGNVWVEFFGAKPINGFDNASAIAKAMSYGYDHSTPIHFMAGKYQTSQSPVAKTWSGIIGQGQNKTIISKTTNNPYIIISGLSVDALLILLPKTFVVDGLDGDNYANGIEIQGITLQREGIADRTNQPTYGIYAPYMASSLLRDLRVECGYYGFWGEDCFSNIFERCGFLGLAIGQFIGFYLGKVRNGVYNLSGTSNLLDQVGVVNYQIGFEIDSQQYTTMNCCTADSIFPMTGTSETISRAYFFHNPHGITMNGCGSEGVKGERLTVVQAATSIYDGTMVINGCQFQVVPSNPPISFPIFRFENQGTNSFNLYITVNSSNFRRDSTTTPNLTKGYVYGGTGAVTVVRFIASVLEEPITSGNVDVKLI
ncbi:tail fiber/spike domain-containing protein [Hafnia paralvei]|uniref:tail fiber/spike domain-containing protein n=1 Tax=Hafnia paralvei TaxID=546367 RepID=UPI001CCCDB13|nr:hypothetical protein [Hafnia paralvei]UBM42015.1 hypothetical protein K9N75_06055 [Hafnia paralvei]